MLHCYALTLCCTDILLHVILLYYHTKTPHHIVLLLYECTLSLLYCRTVTPCSLVMKLVTLLPSYPCFTLMLFLCCHCGFLRLSLPTKGLTWARWSPPPLPPLAASICLVLPVLFGSPRFSFFRYVVSSSIKIIPRVVCLRAPRGKERWSRVFGGI